MDQQQFIRVIEAAVTGGMFQPHPILRVLSPTKGCVIIAYSRGYNYTLYRGYITPNIDIGNMHFANTTCLGHPLVRQYRIPGPLSPTPHILSLPIENYGSSLIDFARRGATIKETVANYA